MEENASTTINTNRFSKICRTCLLDRENEPILNVFYGEQPISDLLQIYTAVEVHFDDNLPQNICYKCISKLLKAHLFIKKCQQSNTTLLQIKNERVSKIESSEVIVAVDDELVAVDDDLVTVDDDLVELFEEVSPNIEDHGEIEQNELIEFPKSTTIHKFTTESTSFQCKSCELVFENFSLLKQHRRKKHMVIRRHACSVCSKKFTTSMLRQHMKIHSKEKPYKCKMCFQGFRSSCNLKRHMMIHTGERPYICEECGKGFIQLHHLKKHKRTHSKIEIVNSNFNDVSFKCNFCGRTFKRLGSYNVHLNTHFLSENGEPKKPLQNSEIREHECDVCKKQYKTKQKLKLHQIIHREKSFLCSVCGKGFVKKAAMDSHFKVHSGEKPYTCKFCNKSFAQTGSFDSHIRIHMRQKPFVCTICERAFTQKSHLRYHSRTHSGERPYDCSYCGKTFALKGNLTVHIRIHTGETPYLCPVCGKGFYDSSSMKKHKKGHGVDTE